MRNIPIRTVILEKLSLTLQRIAHPLLRRDVQLTTVDHADEPELEGVDAAGEDVEGVGAGVHEVELGEDADGAAALGVDVTG